MSAKEYLEGHTGWMIGMGVAGIALLASGLVADKNWLQVIGGALFGAALGAFISLLDASKTWNLVIRHLNESLRSEFRGEERKAETYRKIWHLYYVSKMHNETIWRHVVLDFSGSTTTGELRTDARLKGTLDEEHIYAYHGAFRDCRLVLFAKEKGSDEPCTVHVFPFMGESYQATHAGIAFLRTWDMTNGVFPAIMATFPINNYEPEGIIKNKDLIIELKRVWNEHFERINDILPIL